MRADEVAAELRRAAVRAAQLHATLQPEVQIVFPREADPTVALERFAVTELLGIVRGDLGDTRSDRGAVHAGRERVRGVPRGRAGRSDRDVHRGELVLDRLERTD